MGHAAGTAAAHAASTGSPLRSVDIAKLRVQLTADGALL
jgi:hypothetical protein